MVRATRKRCVDLATEAFVPNKFYNLRSWIKKPSYPSYNLRSRVKKKKYVEKDYIIMIDIEQEKLKKQVEEDERSGDVQFIKQKTFIPTKHGNWNKDRLPCPNCNIDICKLPGWSCDNVCCRSCLYSFC